VGVLLERARPGELRLPPAPGWIPAAARSLSVALATAVAAGLPAVRVGDDEFPPADPFDRFVLDLVLELLAAPDADRVRDPRPGSAATRVKG